MIARVCAQAKINLSLRILAREETGYHQLETILLRVDLGDTVTVRVGGRGRKLDTRGFDLGAAEQNLAMRAAVAYQSAADWPGGFEIVLEKVIAPGTGLGGGSADAGAVLRGLNAMSPRPFGQETLLTLAAALGADVPFLTMDAPLALAWGRGDRFIALPPPPPRPVVIVVPPFAVRTADAYGWLAAPNAADASTPQALELAALSSWEALEALAGNDFEPVVGARHPEIAGIVAVLRARGARVAQLTGSGAAVFGIFDAPPSIDDVTMAVEGEAIATSTSARVVGVELSE